MWEKITIQIVGWNSSKDLLRAIGGLKNVDENVVIRYIDNNSTDGSVEMIRRQLPRADVVELSENKGFAEANNIGFRMCDTEFVMLHNPDLTVNLGGVREVLEIFKEKKVGAAQGKLYRDENNILDSAGITMTLALNGRERGAGEYDSGQYDEIVEVGAVTGAAGIYRMAALRQVAYADFEVFDKEFFAYKEEVDLGWRLRKLGWKCIYVPVKQGDHPRRVRMYKISEFMAKPSLLIDKISDKRTRYSFRNWVWMVLKNVTVKQAFKHEVFVDLRLVSFVTLSLFYWPLWQVWGEIIKGIPLMLEKRSNKLNK